MATLRNLTLDLFSPHGITKITETVQAIGRNPLRSLPPITYRHTRQSAPTLKSPWAWTMAVPADAGRYRSIFDRPDGRCHRKIVAGVTRSTSAGEAEPATTLRTRAGHPAHNEGAETGGATRRSRDAGRATRSH
jgi:hypothetical protein